MSQTEADFTAIKQRQQKMWACGDFSAVATQHVIVGELLLERLDPSSEDLVLDVACGSGNAALASARRGCVVTGIDFVPTLLERGRERAQAERLAIEFLEGDAEKLEFPGSTFDIVVSTFGVMFAPNQTRAADELLRVCRPGGKIGLTCWTPEGSVGQMNRLRSRYMPLPPGVQPPTRWGTERGLRELFGDRVSDLQIVQRQFRYRHPSPQAWLDHFRENFGPTRTVWESLDADQRAQYEKEALTLVTESNVATDGTLKFDGDYLEVVAILT